MGRAARQRQFPDEPWRWRAAWMTGVIRDDGPAKVTVIWIVAIGWNAITLPRIGWLALHPARDPVPWAFLACFPLVGVVLLVAAIYQTMKAFRFGRSELTLDPFPARPGEPLNVTVRVANRLADVDVVTVTLQCVRSVTRSAGRNRSTSFDVIWEADRAAPPTDDKGNALLRATFDVPADAAATDDANPSDRMLWRLLARAPRPGLDYAATFELPLYRRRARDASRPVEPFARGIVPPPATGLPIDELARQRVTVLPLAGRGFTIEFPPGRRPAAALFVTCFAIGLDAIFAFAVTPHGMFAVAWSAPSDDAFEWFFRLFLAIGFGIVGLLITGLAVAMWLCRTTATVDRDGVRVARSVLGIAHRRTLAGASIVGVAPKQTLEAGGRVFYSIEVATADGKPFTFGSGIEGRQVADRLSAAIERAFA